MPGIGEQFGMPRSSSVPSLHPLSLAFRRGWPIIAALHTSCFYNLERRRLTGESVSAES